jgi:hypothetical protein
MSKTQVPARNIASKKVVPAKKNALKKDSKPIKKAKSAVPNVSSQSSTKSEQKEKVKKSSQATKTS